jgi:RHH-type rel operon transcriptional repressor/antitoxin RelB
MIPLRLPPEIEERLEALAQRTGRSASDYARDAIIDHLDDLEDIEIAERRLEALRRGETDTIPLAELLKQYGMDH